MRKQALILSLALLLSAFSQQGLCVSIVVKAMPRKIVCATDTTVIMLGYSGAVAMIWGAGGGGGGAGLDFKIPALYPGGTGGGSDCLMCFLKYPNYVKAYPGLGGRGGYSVGNAECFVGTGGSGGQSSAVKWGAQTNPALAVVGGGGGGGGSLPSFGGYGGSTGRPGGGEAGGVYSGLPSSYYNHGGGVSPGTDTKAGDGDANLQNPRPYGTQEYIESQGTWDVTPIPTWSQYARPGGGGGASWYYCPGETTYRYVALSGGGGGGGGAPGLGYYGVTNPGGGILGSYNRSAAFDSASGGGGGGHSFCPPLASGSTYADPIVYEVALSTSTPGFHNHPDLGTRGFGGSAGIGLGSAGAAGNGGDGFIVLYYGVPHPTP